LEFRVGHPARLAGWRIVATSYRVARTVPYFEAIPGRKWLVVQIRFTNLARARRALPLQEMVRARLLPAAPDGQLIVPLRGAIGISDSVAPGATQRSTLFFSVPSAVLVFTVVVQPALEDAKQLGAAVEIDLNCC
jgi:hypothetical protein